MTDSLSFFLLALVALVLLIAGCATPVLPNECREICGLNGVRVYTVRDGCKCDNLCEIGRLGMEIDPE